MNLYKVFYVVAKNNSFSKVAEELLVTQPSVSYGYVMKKAVEDELKNGELYEIKVDIELPKLLLNLVYIENDLTYIPKVFIKEIKEKYL